MQNRPAAQASIENDFHRLQAGQLLRLGSIEEIQRFLSTAERLDYARLIQALTDRRNEAAAANRAGGTQLAEFVLDLVRAFVENRRPEAQAPSTIGSPKDLLQAVAHAPSALGAARLLRRHGHLLSAQLIEDHHLAVLQQLRQARTDPPPAVVRLLLCFVLIAQHLGDPELIGKFSMIWASYSRDQGRLRAALRRFVKAEAIARTCNSTFLRIGALMGTAGVHDEFEDTARAADDYAAALELAKASPENASAVPGASMKLASCLRGMNRYSDALQLIDSSLAASSSLAPDPAMQQEYELRCRLYRGLLLEDLGRFDEGRAEHRNAARLAGATGDRGREFAALTNLAASFAKVGDMREAVQAFQQLLKKTQAWGNQAMAASTHNNLGNMLLRLGRAADARSHFFAALSTKLSTSHKAGEVISYLGIIDSLHQLGQAEQAREFQLLCLIPLFESGDVGSIKLYASRALAGDADPDLAEQALALVQWAQEAARARGDVGDDLDLSQIIGSWHARHGRAEEAAHVLREAIEIGRAADPSAPVVLRLQISLAKQLSSNPETRQQAFDLLAPIAARIEAQIRQVLLDRRRGDLMDQWISLYGALIRLLTEPGCSLRLGDNPRPADVMAFDLHESAKGRSFASSLADAEMPAPDSVPSPLREEEIRLLRREREYQAEQHREVFERESVRLDRLREIAADLEACWQKMEPHAPVYVKLRRAESARMDDTRALLYDGSDSVARAFVSAFVDETRLTWFVQRSDSPDLQIFHASVGATALLDAAKALRRTFNGSPVEFPPHPPIRRTDPHKRSLEFFERLRGDLLSFLPGVVGIEHLCIAPHGPLHLLPLHALRTGNGRYLAEEFAVTYAPSLSSLRHCMALRQGQAQAPVARRSVFCAGVASCEDTRAELFEQDRAIFENCAFEQVVVESGISASKEAVRRRLSGPAVVHLTCHGFFDETRPLNSGLLLSNGRDRPPRNSRKIPFLERSSFILSAGDLLRTPMSAELVSLRACSTGLQTERNAGDEFEGFSRTLLQAGNAAALVSLWNVDQESSQRFFRRFYQLWADPDRPLQKWRALWMTQKEFLRETAEPFLQHPYHWAPLVLIGDWR